jgi:ribosomal subunit interface protein
MKINYTGKLETLSKEQTKTLDNHYAKLGKLVDRKGEREAHVILTKVRHLHKAEIAMHHFHHSAVGTVSHKDQFTALCAAVDKLEKQLHKIRDKQIDSKRHADGINGKKGKPVVSSAPVVAEKTKTKPVPNNSIHAARYQRSAKPLTVEEAALAIKNTSAYLVFEEAITKTMCVLVRRADGGFDFIEPV